jgi:hypothetical protein
MYGGSLAGERQQRENEKGNGAWSGGEKRGRLREY